MAVDPKRAASTAATAPARLADHQPAESGGQRVNAPPAPSPAPTPAPAPAGAGVQRHPLVHVDVVLRLRCAHCDTEGTLRLGRDDWTGSAGDGADRCAGCGRVLRVEVPGDAVTQAARAARDDLNARLLGAGLSVSEETVYAFGGGWPGDP